MRKYQFFRFLSWVLVVAALLVSVFALWSGVSQVNNFMGALAFGRLVLVALGALFVALLGCAFVALFDLIPGVMRRLESGERAVPTTAASTET